MLGVVASQSRAELLIYVSTKLGQGTGGKERQQHTLIKTNGIGMKAIEMKASVELAQLTPKSVYIALAKSGNPAPKAERMKSFPARTEAAYSG